MNNNSILIPQKYDYLLTGFSGFLGGIIYSKLTAAGFSVITLGRSAVNDISIDLAQQIPFFDKSFNTVIHASGKAHVIPRSKVEADDFYNVNLSGTINLVRGLMKSGIIPQCLIFISSVAVYGRDEGEQIDESYPLLGSSPYAKSKIQAEEFLINWSKQNNVLLTIMRVPLLVGKNPPGNLGAMIRMMKKGFYIGIGSGNVRKSMVLAEDVAEFIPIIKNTGGIYNLTDGVHPTMLELEHAIANQIRVKRVIRFSDAIVKFLALIGNTLGKRSPFNLAVYKKLTTSLTYSDVRARQVGWTPRQVLRNLPEL
ncbi:MAG: NAD-dependent epimerase/dehydratase family protein [Cyclobacteriaceae bacterium]|nr:NAD-dependent epimerase/dehydratase family protein [Cyclobacteriaceae bacterium]